MEIHEQAREVMKIRENDGLIMAWALSPGLNDL
jgi:hypothetical protein